MIWTAVGLLLASFCHAGSLPRESLDYQINRIPRCPSGAKGKLCVTVKNPRSSFSKLIQCQDITSLMLKISGAIAYENISIECLQSLLRFQPQALNDGLCLPEGVASLSETIWKEMPWQVLQIALKRELAGLVADYKFRLLPPKACRKAVDQVALEQLRGFPRKLTAILETCYAHFDGPTRLAVVDRGMLTFVSKDFLKRVLSDPMLAKEDRLSKVLGEVNMKPDDFEKSSGKWILSHCPEIPLQAARRMGWLSHHPSTGCILANPDLIQSAQPAWIDSLARSPVRPRGCILGSNLKIETAVAAFSRFSPSTTKWLIDGCCEALLALEATLIDRLTDAQVLQLESQCPTTAGLGKVLVARRPGLLGLGSKGQACKHVHWRHFEVLPEVESEAAASSLPKICLTHLPPLTLGNVVQAISKTENDSPVKSKAPTGDTLKANVASNQPLKTRDSIIDRLPWENFSNAQLSAIGTPRAGHIDPRLEYKLTFPVTLMAQAERKEDS